MSNEHFTLVLEIHHVKLTGAAPRTNEPDKSVEEIARIVVRDDNLDNLMHKAIKHLGIVSHNSSSTN